jgi:hypothetical protein
MFYNRGCNHPSGGWDKNSRGRKRRDITEAAISPLEDGKRTIKEGREGIKTRIGCLCR